MSFKIVTDTSSNLPLERLAKEDVAIVPFTYYPKDDSSKQMSCMEIERFDGKAYYGEIRKGHLYNTSQITPQVFFDYLAPFAEAGEDILFVSMSSGISGSYNSSMVAKEMLEEAYPERTFCMVDTRAASLGEGIAVLRAIEYRAQGMTIQECYDALMELRKCIYQIFTVEDLRHLQRTGRLSNAAMIIGTVLRIKPILKGNELGQIINIDKVRGSKQAIKALADKYNALVKNPEGQVVGIAHADNQEHADLLKEMLCEKNPPKEVLTVCYEPVTGAHVGPGTVALFFLGDENVRNN
ncbi:MAG: DegV family protein [Eubacteriales bacterium]|nr:DegV family protein [Eubacteriales bacterium]